MTEIVIDADKRTLGTWSIPSGLSTYTGIVTCATINQFVVIGNLITADADDKYAVQWCAIGDPTDWPTPATDDARTKQAGKQFLPSTFGQVQALAGGDFFGYIFQKTAITKMTYIGGDIVFAFDTIYEDIGCVDFNRVESLGEKVFFESARGYHVLQGGRVVDIGHGKVDDTY